METLAGNLSELNSSVQQVLSDNDLLTEILVRLPVVLLLPFKFVSKHWLSLIKSRNFALRRNQNPNLDPPSGIFILLRRLCIRHLSVSTEYDFVQLDKTDSSPLRTTFPFRSDSEPNVRILHSCNGLLLCCIKACNLFVYNPSTNQFKLLPEDRYSKLARVAAKLAFDPIKSHQYKVVYVGTLYDDDDDIRPSLQLQTYSSETGDWSVCPQRFPTRCFSDFNRGIYWNGAIHWLVIGPLHYRFDVNNLVLTTIQNPPTVDGKMYYDHKLFESRGFLLYACVVYTYSTRSRQMNVYGMRNGCTNWSVKYIVDIDYVMKLFPKTPEMPDADEKQQLCLRCVVVGEKEEDSFFVMELFGKILKYNIVFKTLSKVYEFTGSYVSNCFPLIPSLSGV